VPQVECGWNQEIQYGSSAKKTNAHVSEDIKECFAQMRRDNAKFLKKLAKGGKKKSNRRRRKYSDSESDSDSDDSE